MKYKKRNTVIAVSGASHSGKTTFIENAVKEYPNDVLILDEIIRSNNINIDEIRKSPGEYLDLEIDIITKKIDAEEIIDLNYNGKVIFTDRSLVDSYFYYTFYMDKSNFTDEQKEKYHNFLSFLKLKMYDHCNYLYNLIFMFEPITEIKRRDEFTVSDIELVQANEYFFIKNFTYGICENQRKVIDLNPEIASVIVKNIIEGKSDVKNI